MRALGRFIAAVLALLVGTPGGDAATIEERDIAGWTVGAYADDDTGRFSFCQSSMLNDQDVMLFFILAEDFRVVLLNPEWTFRDGSAPTVTIEVDSRARFVVAGDVHGNDLVYLPIDATAENYQHFMNGNRMRVSFDGRTYQFPLAGSFRALTQLVECRAEYANYVAPGHDGGTPNTAVQRGNSAGQAGSSQQAANAPTGPATDRIAYRLEATEFVTNLLNRAGVDGFRLISNSKERGRFGDPDALWVRGELFGAATIVDWMDGYSIDDVAAAGLVGMDGCDDGMNVASRRESAGGVTLVHVAIECRQDRTTSYFLHTVLPREAGGFIKLAYALLNADGADQDDLEAAVAGIEEIAIEVITGQAPPRGAGVFTPL